MTGKVLKRFVLAAGFAILAGCAAQQLHREGLQAYDRGEYEQALAKLTQASTQAPDDLEYRLDVTAHRDSAVQRLIAVADSARASGDLNTAAVNYKRALALDAANVRAQRGLEGLDADRRHAQQVGEAKAALERKDLDTADGTVQAVLEEDPTYAAALQLRDKINIARGTISAAPRLKSRSDARVTLEFRDAPTKMVFEVLSRQTGINFILDKDVKSDGKTTIFVQDVPVEQAIELVLDQNGLARQILSSNMVLIYPNTPAKQKDYEEEIVHTFYVSNAAPKDVSEMLKSVLGAKTLYIDERSGTVVMRDTPDAIRMAERLVASIDVPESEVMLEVEVLEIARSDLLNLGVDYPSSVTATLNGTGTSGGLTLSDLEHHVGPSTIGISSLSATLNLLKQNGLTNTLASPRIRTRNKEKAKILIGSRVPVITNSVTPTSTSAVVTGSVQYLDVGLTLNVQPTVYDDGDVAIKVGLEVSSITNQITTSSGTIAYTIGTRNADTLLRLKDGETQILAGLIQDSDTRSVSSIPLLGDIPLLGRLFGAHNSDREKSEIVLSITPRIVRAPARAASEDTEFWYGTESRVRATPFVTDLSSPSTAPTASGTALRGAAPANAVATSTAAAAPSTTVVTPTITGGAASATSPGAVALATQATAQATAPEELTQLPSVTLSGPGDITVGQEFDVELKANVPQAIKHLRAQVRFDATALQLLSSNAGSLIPSSAGTPSVQARAGGAALDVTSTDEPVQGEGTVMSLHFKALSPRGQTALAAQVSAVSGSGSAAANSAAPPLNLTIQAVQ